MSDIQIDYSRARRAMIDSQLRPSGVHAKPLLAAIDNVPREDFLPDAMKPLAYRDRSLDLEGGTGMAPTPLAKLIDRAGPVQGERALVVGPMADYAAALLSYMGLSVDEAATFDAAMKGEGGEPYDLILFVGAIGQVPDTLVERLAKDGRVAAPIADRSLARLAIGTKVDDRIAFRTFDDAQVPPLKGAVATSGFTF